MFGYRPRPSPVSSTRSTRSSLSSRRSTTSSRYSNLKPTVDTGWSMTKWKDYRKHRVHRKRNELFNRMKTSELAELLSERVCGQETIYALEESVETLNLNEVQNESPRTPRSATYDASATPPPSEGETSFLLLDLRQVEDFEKCHVLGASSYPTAMLSRSVNCFTPEIYSFRNKPNRKIILYDLDEKLTAHYANVFIERGIENIWVVNGGLREFAYHFPGMLQGEDAMSIIHIATHFHETDLMPSPANRTNSQMTSPTETESVYTRSTHRTSQTRRRLQMSKPAVFERPALSTRSVQSSRLSSPHAFAKISTRDLVSLRAASMHPVKARKMHHSALSQESHAFRT